MLSRDLRRLQRKQREVTRQQLARFLVYAFRAACDEADLIGRFLNRTTMHQAEGAMVDLLCKLADRGVFRYFGIDNALQLGAAPIAVTEVAAYPGALVIGNLADVCEWIMRGGARGAGWLAASELGLDDLER